MNPFFEAVQGPAAQRLGWVLIHLVWQATLVALAFRLALWCLRLSPAQTRYLAGCLSLLLVAIAPCITYLWLSTHTAPGIGVVATVETPMTPANQAGNGLSSAMPKADGMAVASGRTTWLGTRWQGRRNTTGWRCKQPCRGSCSPGCWGSIALASGCCLAG